MDEQIATLTSRVESLEALALRQAGELADLAARVNAALPATVEEIEANNRKIERLSAEIGTMLGES